MKHYKTQNDINGNEVLLDYQSLLTVASIAQGHSMEGIRRYMSELTYPNQPNQVKLELTTRRLADEAYRLAIIGETLAALRYGLERETVTIINREVITE